MTAAAPILVTPLLATPPGAVPPGAAAPLAANPRPHQSEAPDTGAPWARHRCTPEQVPPLRALLARYGIVLQIHPDGASLPGSFWGESEAGIVGTILHVRPDTPVHSALHEAGHLICMDAARRAVVHTDAGGNDLEESAVCRLQILLADHLPDIGHKALMDDMDAWGYSFRLGSTAAWFDHDSEDAEGWLRDHGLVDRSGNITFRTRQ